jgi:UDP-N-acetylglucosamine pyrophosphorylase
MKCISFSNNIATKLNEFKKLFTAGLHLSFPILENIKTVKQAVLDTGQLTDAHDYIPHVPHCPSDPSTGYVASKHFFVNDIIKYEFYYCM